MAGLYYLLLDPHSFENNFFGTSIHLNVHEVSCSDFWHLCGMESSAGTNLRSCQHPELSGCCPQLILPTALPLGSSLPLVEKYFSILPNQRNISLNLCFNLRKDHGIFFSKGNLLHLFIKPGWPYWHLYFYAIGNGGCSRGV